MQKYIHLVQIVETEKVAANQLRTQLEDQDTEIERLKAEVQHVYTHKHTPAHLKGIISVTSNPIFIPFMASSLSAITLMFLHSVIVSSMWDLNCVASGNNACKVNGMHRTKASA